MSSNNECIAEKQNLTNCYKNLQRNLQKANECQKKLKELEKELEKSKEELDCNKSKDTDHLDEKVISLVKDNSDLLRKVEGYEGKLREIERNKETADNKSNNTEHIDEKVASFVKNNLGIFKEVMNGGMQVYRASDVNSLKEQSKKLQEFYSKGYSLLELFKEPIKDYLKLNCCDQDSYSCYSLKNENCSELMSAYEEFYGPYEIAT